MKLKHAFSFISLFFVSLALSAQLDLPLFDISKIQYKGAFRIPASTYGASSINYSEGPIAYNAANHSLYVVGHDHHQGIGEFSIPELIVGEIAELNMSINLQPFVQHLGIADCGPSQGIDQIGGMMMIDGALYVNAYEYYDANGSVTNTTMIIDDPTQLSSTSVRGFFNFEGGAGHTSGWMSSIPLPWRDSLGGSHITGQSSGIPIISRTSVGPSAFSFTPLSPEAGCEVEMIPTNRLLDFSLANPLHSDLSNDSGFNDLWTHLSRATYGMIVPGTKTYLTIGSTGGHKSGVCYKCEQDNENLCGGYCPPEASDRDQYYWLWDLTDLLAVKNGEMEAHDVRPYDYGPFHTPFESVTKQIGGGTFDTATSTLYLSLQRADTEQGTYSRPPIIVAYDLSNLDCLTFVNVSTSNVYNGMSINASALISSDAIVSQTRVDWYSSIGLDVFIPFEVAESSEFNFFIRNCDQ